MIVGGRKTNLVKFKKIASGKIVKTIEEQYLRSDIPCGIANSPFDDSNTNCRLKLELADKKGYRRVSENEEMEDEDSENETKRIDKIFIIDHHFALDQIDLIENCDVLSNVVVCDSVLKHLNKINIQAFHGLRNVTEFEDRRFYYFYNENCSETSSKALEK